jgi:putative oxidoreductase
MVRTSKSIPLMVVRLGLGIVMFAHGAQKALGWFGGPGLNNSLGFFEHMGLPPALAYLPIAAELLGGLGLILGFLTRIAAFGVLCDMVAAVVLVHGRNGFFMNWSGTLGREGFEFHILAISMALAVLIGGAGACSIDRLFTREVRRSEPPPPVRRYEEEKEYMRR